MHLSIDHALAVSYRRDQHGQNAKFVARITLVKGIPFYGFHVGYRFFLKIYMFNPIVMTRLADLLQQGVIMKQKFQPYEAHLQYLLQFMIDYNLYGCDYLDTSKANFRSPVPEHDQGSNSSHLWHSVSIPTDLVTDEPTLPRMSHCSIEVDICVQNIVNRRMVKERRLHHNFSERVSSSPKDLKLVYSMAGLWRDETKRRRRQMPKAQQGNSPFPAEVLVTMSADTRDSQPQGWIHEDEYRQEVRELVSQEATEMSGNEVDFDTFTEPVEFESQVNTALQSVEDLYPSKLLAALGVSSDPSQHLPDPASSIDVDEKKALQVQGDGDDFFPEDSDDDTLHGANDDGPPSKNGAPKHIQRTHESRTVIQERLIHNEEAASLHFLQMPGITSSILRTGKVPNIPVLRAFVDAAIEDGLLTRAPGADISASEPLQKRKTDYATMDVAPKRLKSELYDVASISEVSHIRKDVSGRAQPGVSRRRSRAEVSEGPNDSCAPVHRSQTNHTLNTETVKDKNGSSRRRDTNEESSLVRKTGARKEVSFGGPSASGTGRGIDSHEIVTPNGVSTSSSHSESSVFKMQRAPLHHNGRQMLIFAVPPPTWDASMAMEEHQIPAAIYQHPYYSKEKDVNGRAREYAGREYRLESNTVPFLPPFDLAGQQFGATGEKVEATVGIDIQSLVEKGFRCSWRAWECSQLPPSYLEVSKWVKERTLNPKIAYQARWKPLNPVASLSQIDGPTPKNKHGFKYTQKQSTTSVEHEVQYMSTLCLEIHVNTRGKFVPNPEEDEIQCIFWACKSDERTQNTQESVDALKCGILVLSDDGVLAQRVRRMTKASVTEEDSELGLLVRMVEVVRTFDPDILTGFEVHSSSWGYLIERARLKYDYDLCDEFSRMKTDSHGRIGKANDRWGFNTTSTIRITGRHMINIWRAMQSELNLLQYTMENVAWHLLHRRVPHYSWKTLTKWYKSGKTAHLAKLLRYYQARARLDMEILEANELIARTSEQARLLGIDFFSVFSRGSQFKVESIMSRIAKPENFIFISPSKKQVGGQNALECLPLVMEPQSAFYSSPLLVLDFQSLYPSVMIAYNYCYSTFLGRIKNWRGAKSKMGFTEYERQKGLLVLLKDYINIAPNGMMYVKAEIRKSLLAKMLTEILETRVMVKSGMKKDKDDKTLQQLLNNRQLALKLLANVTYGYTSASFSGRMPCSEIADSIVQTGRETLERAIAYIHSVERWGAEVVYGDTDSLFIYLKGRTRDQAFDIGDEIVKAITAMSPRPIKLKFEKVYHPCVLVAKKRYVGYKYESRGQEKPDFDAKGIETVRRDGTPAEQKMEERALRLLFETADLSRVKAYFQSQCDKIMRGAVSVHDFCFAREVRLGTYSDRGPPPAGALISAKRMLEDARAEPQYGERVPYVVITGAPGARLMDRCVAPEDLVANPHWQLDAEYYISKNLIPPLERIFNLVGANVRQWYDEMPKVQRAHHAPPAGAAKKATLEAYMRSTRCLVCDARCADDGHRPLCAACRAAAPASAMALQTRLAARERALADVLDVCRSCSGADPLDDVPCDSRDCPVFWTRMKQRTKLATARATTGPVLRELLEAADREALEW